MSREIIVLAGGTRSPTRKEWNTMSNGMIRSPKIVWRKADASNEGGGCIEVADLGIAIRDSKDPDGPHLYYTRAEFAAFLQGARGGEFDHLLSAIA